MLLQCLISSKIDDVTVLLLLLYDHGEPFGNNRMHSNATYSLKISNYTLTSFANESIKLGGQILIVIRDIENRI